MKEHDLNNTVLMIFYLIWSFGEEFSNNFHVLKLQIKTVF